ncbi:MAG: hypothetical protein Tsb009_05760 [Planctomycetaceae bacterium]
MKNLVIATLTVVGLGGMLENNQAEASHGRRGRGIRINIGGGGVSVGIGQPGFGRPGCRPGGICVKPLPRPYPRPLPRPPVVRCYYVKYAGCGTRKRHLDCYRSASRFASQARSLGFHVRIRRCSNGHYDVIYHMHGSRMKRFSSHYAAHRYERWLERLGMGINARVIHS